MSALNNASLPLTTSMGQPEPEGLPGLPKQGDLIAEKYRVERVLGKGGMGIVVAAEHLALRKTVAVKFLLPEAMTQPDAVERFFREARIAASIRNEHVARVMDVGMLGSGAPYLVMEYLVGTDLSKLLNDRERLPVLDAVDYVLQACEALVEVHQVGLVHRDLKPGNLFLTEDTAGAPVVKVLDFGISKVVAASAMAGEHSLTATDVVLGSVYYMAPEQIRGLKNLDARVDIWALGVILYQLITGRRPFRASLMTELLLSIAEDPPPTFQELGVTVPAGLEAVILRCLEKHRERRFEKVADLAVALEPFGTKSARLSVARILLAQPTFRPSEPDSETTRRRPVTALPALRPRAITGPGLAPIGEGAHTALPRSGPRSSARPSARHVWLGARIRGSWRFRAGLLAGLFAAGFVVVWAVMRAPIRVPVPYSSDIDAERLASFACLSVASPRPLRAADAAKIKLGRALFDEPRLSQYSDVSCSSCHPLDRYGADGKPRSRGTHNREPPRNTLSVYNVAGAFALLWDGRKDTLEAQAEEALLSDSAMAMTKEQLEKTLRDDATYVSAFKVAFPDDHEPVSLRNTQRALSAFEETLFTPGRWDRFLAGDKGAITPEEKAGFNRFVDVGCVSCHFGVNVGATMFQKVGLVKPWPDTRDRGRYEITRREADWMVFKVPSLRNVAETGPYFHDGAIASLEEAIRMMARHQIGRELDQADVALILAWLKCLTGEISRDAVQPGALRK